MATRRVHNLILLAALLPGGAAPAVALDGGGPLAARLAPPSFSPLEAELLRDAADGQLEQFTLLEAALIAGRVADRVQLQQWVDRFAELSSHLKPSIHTPPNERAAHVLEFLHQQLLTGSYLPACTEVDRSLERGDYNCVTASVLYRCLGDAVDLPVLTLAEPGHVYCKLADAESIVIQTTSPQGLLADSDAGGAGAEAGGRRLSDVQLLAKIYYNRGVNLAAGEAFAAALPLLELAWQLDPEDAVARRNVLACLNNWALAECAAGRYAAAIALLEQGQRVEPDYPAFADNDGYIRGRWARHLCDEGRYEEAVAVLRAADRRHPPASTGSAESTTSTTSTSSRGTPPRKLDAPRQDG